MKAVLVCSCPGIKAKAEASFQLNFSDEQMPTMYAGQSQISKLQDTLDLNTNIYRYVQSLNSGKSQFAYVIEWDYNGDVLSIFNLLTSKLV